MIAILDACSALNLIYANFDDRYFTYLNKSFDELIICKEVFEEIATHRNDNMINEDNRDVLNDIVYQHLNRYVTYTEIEKEADFIGGALGYQKRNGEFYSIGHALAKSRLGIDNLSENLLKAHFITDDFPATEEFGYFYHINAIGKILDCIDLVTLFCLKGLISRGEVFSFCQALKFSYNLDAALLSQELKLINKKEDEHISSKERSLVTKMIEILDDLDDSTIERVQEISHSPSFTGILNKYKKVPLLIKSFVGKKSREKIPFINKRIQDLKKVWELDYNN